MLQCRSKAVFFSHEVQTIFQAAGLQLTVKETERAGHATEMVRELAISSCEAVVTVGGDGTVHEALQVSAMCFCIRSPCYQPDSEMLHTSNEKLQQPQVANLTRGFLAQFMADWYFMSRDPVATAVTAKHALSAATHGIVTCARFFSSKFNCILSLPLALPQSDLTLQSYLES